MCTNYAALEFTFSEEHAAAMRDGPLMGEGIVITSWMAEQSELPPDRAKAVESCKRACQSDEPLSSRPSDPAPANACRTTWYSE